MYQDLLNKKKAISVTGLGYVGLPLALEFAKHFKVIGFDISKERIAMMQQSIDPSQELEASAFIGTDIEFTTNPDKLKHAHFHIIGVPTDIDEHKVPNLIPLKSASKSVGLALKKGDFVVYESTVYPGCTEEDCLPILEKYSGLKLTNEEFSIGYSPERINPGDKIRTLTTILKIVSGHNSESSTEISKIYNHIIKAGIYKAPSIKVAEAAKVIENTQRDLNISLMNELAVIFDKIGIDTNEVIDAAGSKWNFHKYRPGLVGGHCIGVDPFYLMHKAKQVGLDPQVIAAGRRVNDYIPRFIAKKIVTSLIEKGKNPGESKALVLGVTFKENVSDIRNSKVFELIKELKDYSIKVDVLDPFASSKEVYKHCGNHLVNKTATYYDSVVVAVNHQQFSDLENGPLSKIDLSKMSIYDVKGVLKKYDFENYWSL